MHWPPDIVDELPTPRDDEPASLRQDIADELADHLECAFNRELHLTRDEHAARENTLHRFGDPRAVARKLWFDALKEQIMSQRLSLVLTTLMAVACLAATALAWTTMREGRDVNAAILERLESLQPPPTVVPVPSEWSEVKVRAVLDQPDGKPAAGYRLSLNGYVYNTGSTKDTAHLNYGTLDETVGASGEVDFGMLRGGSYTLSATSPWGETMNRTLGVRPGKPVALEIVCPAKAPEKAKVHATVALPEDYPRQEILVRLNFSSCSRKLDVANAWSASPSVPSAVINRRGEIAIMDGRSLKPLDRGDLFRTSTPLNFSADSLWPEGEYTINTIEILQPTEKSERILQLMATVQVQPTGNVMNNMGGGMMGGGMMGGGGGFFQVADESFREPVSIFVSELPTPRLIVLPGKVNEWNITLPDEVFE